MQQLAGPQIDLHLHSIYSDGLLTPAQLVKEAESAGLSLISLTDHDSIGGVEQAAVSAKSRGLEFIPGVELSTLHNGSDIHILGYFIDIGDPTLLDSLARFAKARFDRAQKIIERLKGQGLDVSFEAVQAIAGPGPIGRPHIAEALVSAGHVRTQDEAFIYYIGHHCPAYVRKYELTPKQAVEIIHDAQGLAVLAHPLAGKQRCETVLQILESGVDGLEVIHPKMTAKDSKWLISLAGKKDLLKTGGSDYHGQGRSYTNLGETNIPLEFAQDLIKRRKN